jgi:hypothetical protein
METLNVLMTKRKFGGEREDVWITEIFMSRILYDKPSIEAEGDQLWSFRLFPALSGD